MLSLSTTIANIIPLAGGAESPGPQMRGYGKPHAPFDLHVVRVRKCLLL